MTEIEKARHLYIFFHDAHNKSVEIGQLFLERLFLS
jgi:hypothetical protein